MDTNGHQLFCWKMRRVDLCIFVVMFWIRTFCASITLVAISAIAAEPTPSSTATPAESPAATIAQSVTDISAQRAQMERSRIFHAGRDYSLWLDQLAKDSGSAFLQRPVFERVSWMRLLGAIGGLVLLSILAGGFVWIVHRRAGEIKSGRHQSALQLAASAIRK